MLDPTPEMTPEVAIEAVAELRRVTQAAYDEIERGVVLGPAYMAYTPTYGSPATVLGMLEAMEETRSRIEELHALATEWATQPNDFDEDTEQQIADGRAVLAILERPFEDTDEPTTQENEIHV